MAQVKLLKIDADGVPVEFNSAADDITLNSFAVQGGGPVLGPTGLDLNNQDVSDIKNLAFVNPATGTINQTAGALIVDNILGKDRENVMASGGAVLFPVITNNVDLVDSFRVPALAGVPSATPADGGSGYLVFDSTNKALYVWDGAAWDNLNTTTAAESLASIYTAEQALAAVDAVYISSADNVSKASASAAATAKVIGFAKAAALITAPTQIVKAGILAGFSGLTAGARYFLSATAGAVTATRPSGAGNTIVQVGYAKNATTLEIAIENLGRLAA